MQDQKEQDETRSVDDRERSGRTVSVVSRKLKNAIKRRIRRNSERSNRKMSSKFQCFEKSDRNAIKDMGMKSVSWSSLTQVKKETSQLQSNPQPVEGEKSGEGFHRTEDFQS